MSQEASLLETPLAPWGQRSGQWQRRCQHAQSSAYILSGLPTHLQQALCRSHPHVSDPDMSLKSKLATLPTHLHAAACQAHVQKEHRGMPRLQIRGTECETNASMLTKLSEAVSQLH